MANSFSIFIFAPFGGKKEYNGGGGGSRTPVHSKLD